MGIQQGRAFFTHTHFPLPAFPAPTQYAGSPPPSSSSSSSDLQRARAVSCEPRGLPANANKGDWGESGSRSRYFWPAGPLAALPSALQGLPLQEVGGARSLPPPQDKSKVGGGPAGPHFPAIQRPMQMPPLPGQANQYHRFNPRKAHPGHLNTFMEEAHQSGGRASLRPRGIQERPMAPCEP